MEKKSEILQVEDYVKEVSHLLPYPVFKKKEALNVLRVDVLAAMKDSIGKSPAEVFGDPHEVAMNISQGKDWYHERANWLIRFLAWLIDIFIEGSFLIAYLGIGFLLLLPIMPLDDLIESSNWYDVSYILSPQGLFLIVFISFLTITSIIFFIGYNAILEFYFGATVGKKIFNLLVVDQSGIKVTWKQAIIRNLSKIFISEEFLPIDVILGMILERFDPKRTRKQRGLDILAETIVIKV